MKAERISIRQAGEGDADFLCAVFKSTRLAELQGVGWSVAQVDQFLQQQQHFQTQDWKRTRPDASWQVILIDEEPAGRLITDRRTGSRDFRVMDIALLPAYRNRGVGSRILGDLVASAHAEGWKVSIHVELNNPAKRLYERLGFVQVEERGIYLLMECAPGLAVPAGLARAAGSEVMTTQPF